MSRSKLPLRAMVFTYISLFILIVIGHVRDIFGRLFYPKKYTKFKHQNGKLPLYTLFESFFIRRIFFRIQYYWNRPITGVPGRSIRILNRTFCSNKTYSLTNKHKDYINVGSYNYLGFATKEEPFITSIVEVLQKYPLNISAPTRDVGMIDIIVDLEREVAKFLHKEDCIVFSMGFGTNSSNIPVLLDDETLVMSDELNHISMITGIRLSKAVVRVFKHNDMKDLENQLVLNISQGQPITHRSWSKIVVFVEGLYSMEGNICKIEELVELKKKYKFYIFIDEAHSVGALGETGRGICELRNVNFDDVDILMGTFSKSFGASGGYIASSRDVVRFLRFYSDFSLYGEQMSPVVAKQILESLRCIRDTEVGKAKLLRLRENVAHIRRLLNEKKFLVLGDSKSPVVPILISNPGKIAEFTRLCSNKGVAVVSVGYPATSILHGRSRLCVSASHTKEDIEKIVSVIDEVGTLLGIKYNYR